MKKELSFLLLFLILFGIAHSQSLCPVMCDTCPNGQNTCSSCYHGFEYNQTSQFTTTGTCPCPDGFWLNTTSQLCIFCPVTCETCSLQTTCITCISGYQLDKDKLCVKKVSNAGQWFTMDIANDLTQQKLSKVQIQGFYLIDYVASYTVTSSIKNCSGLGSRLFFGLNSFDYNTQIYKSYYGLAHHDWIQIKFQFVAADKWTSTSMILEVNNIQSYRFNTFEAVGASQIKTYSSSQRQRSFCLSSQPDNLGFISLYIPHSSSMLKIKIRTDLSDRGAVDPSEYPSYVYFGIRNLFVRGGSCPTNCKKCYGPDLCAECIKPYTTSLDGLCVCDATIAQVTELNRCVPKCSTGYIFTKIESMTESKCLLCSLISDKLKNCYYCQKSLFSGIQCTICSQGYYLNSTGYCINDCPSVTQTSVSLNNTYGVYVMKCQSCLANCLVCSYGTCSSCVSNTYFQASLCKTTCSGGFYLDIASNQCYKCPMKCSKCTSVNVCTECTDIVNYTLSNGQCLPACLATNTCNYSPCDTSCQTCFGPDSTQCLTCSSTSALQDYSCVPACTARYFLYDNKICQKCPYPCYTCRNFQSCTYCQMGYYLFQQKCIRYCPLSYYPDAAQSCQSCQINCKSCYSFQICIQCANNYILFEGKCILQKPCSLRVEYYYDQKISKCLPCGQNCTSCYKDLCYRCTADSVLDNGECMSQCSSQKVQYLNYYIDPLTNVNTSYRICKWRDPLCNNYIMVSGNSVCSSCLFTNPMLVLLNSTYSNKCSFTCPLATVKVESNNILSCQNCPANCQQCLSNLTCIRCSPNYVANPVKTAGQVDCLASCPQGYTSDGYQCIQCQANCKVCDIIGRCLTCVNLYTLTMTNTCTNDTGCAISMFKNSGVCTNCPTGCLTCTNLSTCTSCGILLGVQLYLKSSSCVSDCQAGFFKQDFGYQCRKCPVQCVTCVSSTQCVSCTPGYFLLFHPIQRFLNIKIGTCVLECPFGYFNYNPVNTDNREVASCQFCSANCLTCFGPTQDQCLSCYGTFKMDHNSRCVERCPVGKYQDATAHCDWCHPSCIECTGPAEYQCVNCATNFYLYRTTCYANSCPGSTYSVDYDTRICQNCQWGCQVCSNPYNCSVCTGGFYLYQGWCYLQCPFNTIAYLDLQVAAYKCGNCSSKWGHCVECQSSKCSRCQWPYFILDISVLSTPCVTNCPLAYFAQSSPVPKCIRCPDSCLSCISNTYCTKCSQGYVLNNNGQCTNSCPSYQFFSQLTSQCRSCSQFCINCVSQYQCQNCISGYYLMTELISGFNTSYCSKECGDYYYQDQTNSQCNKCSINCNACRSFTNCTKCLTGFNLTNGYCYQNNTIITICLIPHCSRCLSVTVCEVCEIPYYNSYTFSVANLAISTCVTACPNGFYEEGRICQSCNSTCTSCDSGPNDCSSCIQGLYLQERRCWKDCPLGFYKNSTLKTCAKCPLSCFDCLNSTFCKTCQSGSILYNGMCYSACPSGTYQSGSQCLSCLSSCQACQDITYCSDCLTPYFKFQNTCVLQCPATYYLSVSEMSCKKCLLPCTTCTSDHQCTSCMENFVLSKNGYQCLESCDIGYFAKITPTNGYQCSPCGTGCNNCVNATYCEKCSSQFYTWKGRCLQSCPIGTYPESSTKFCIQCSQNCIACTSSSACIQCHNQTLLFDGKCLNFCPIGTYETYEYSITSRSSSSVCKNCISPCKQCTGQSIYNCLSCINGFFLYQTLCLISCPVGYLADSSQNKCIKCPFGCSICTNSQSCTQCIDGWTLSGNNQCKPPVVCTLPNCQTCQTLNTTVLNCYMCVNPYFLINNTLLITTNTTSVSVVTNSTYTCILSCPSTTFKALNLTCSPCPTGCLNCYYADCSICKSGYFFYKNSCVQICPNGYITSSTLGQCIQNPCLYNNSLTLCQLCISPYLIQAGKCVTSCSDRFYRDQQYCVQCDQINAHCYTCTTLSNCTSCVTSYFLYQGACINICPAGFYQDGTGSSITCKSCSVLEGCAQCNSSTKCQQCMYPYFLNSLNTCTLNCPDGMYKSQYDNSCKLCEANCLSCLNQTACTRCNRTTTILFKADCFSDCPIGFYKDSRTYICEICNSKCISCNSLTNCTACQTNFFLLSTISASTLTYSCVDICPVGFYSSINSSCVSCSSQCLTCNFQKCLTCPTGKYLFNGKCLTVCPQHYFGLNGKCAICNTQCKTCAQSKQACTSCYSGFIYITASKTCTQNCSLTNQYYDPTTFSCLNCSSDCQTCFGPRYDQCLSCQGSFALSKNTCVVKCPDGYFRNTNSVCEPCDQFRCLTCQSTSTNCQSCIYPSVLVVTNNVGQCRVNCGSGFYYDPDNRQCKQCSSGCVSCINQMTCLVCDNTRYLYEGSCLNLCPIGYTAINGTSQNYCKKCPINCINCISNVVTGSIQCTTCISALLIFNGTCYNQCPVSTYTSASSCINCPDQCATCSSNSICLTCKYPYLLYQNQCLTSCPANYQPTNSKCYQKETCPQFTYQGICYSQCPVGTFVSLSTCVACPVQCQSCQSATVCTVCKSGFNMYVNAGTSTASCLQNCPSSTYLNNKYCLNCPAPCSTCSAFGEVINCDTCLNSLILYSGTCINSCPSGFYADANSNCTKCSEKCLTCDANGCTACANSAYNIPTCQTSTTISCSAGYFVSRTTNNCQICNAACLSCFGASAAECTACKNISSTLYYLYGTSCVTQCPDGYTKDSSTNKCTKCSIPSCKTCNTVSSCTSCASGYILFTNSTVTKCILSCSQLSTATSNWISTSNTTLNCASCSSLVTNCFECYYSTTQNKPKCLTCAVNYYISINDGSCISCTAPGYIISSVKYCVQCDVSCATCLSQTACQTCQVNYALYLGKCITTCPNGFYKNGQICNPCQNKCNTCNSTQCLTCITPYALDVSNHCTTCINGYFMDTNSICQKCSTNCLECSTASTSCTKCVLPLLLFNNKCNSQCPTGYYANTVPAIDTCDTCTSLVASCSVCTAAGCSKCADTYFLFQQTTSTPYTCVLSCPVGFYADTANMKCLQCTQSNCLACTSSTQCTKCSSSYYLFQGYCLSACPLGYALSTAANGDLQCVPCQTGCKSCPVSVNTCTLCEAGLQNNGNGQCSTPPNTCTSSQYLNALGTCFQCHYTCLTCYGGLRTNCLTCRTPQYSLQTDGTCKEICSAPQYYDVANSICVSCSSKYGQYCIDCDSSTCFSCSSGILSSDGQSCTTTCLQGTYQLNNACIDCPQYCKVCTSSTFCTQCTSPSEFLYNNLCYLTCPLMTQPFGGSCRACDDKCLTCVTTTTNCNSCKLGYKYYQNTCLDVCPIGTYQGTQINRNGAVCIQCTSPCSNCSMTSTNCTSCLTSFKLYQNMCVNPCPAGTLQNTVAQTCIVCTFPCLTCISASTNCTSCASGYVPNAGNTCSSQCSTGQYLYTNPSTSATSCVSCALSNCKQCDANRCYKCLTGFYASVSNGIITSCTPTCPDYYFPQNSTNTCEKCSINCLTCTSPTTCQKCASPFVLYNNQCQNSCPSRTYELSNIGAGFVCSNCSTLCLTCTDNNTCTECQTDAYLLTGKCYMTCPSGYYPLLSDKSCRPCAVANCSTCTSTQCSACAPTFFAFINNATNKIQECRSECGDTFYQNIQNSDCQGCIDGCKTCQNGTSCIECESAKTLLVIGSAYSCVIDCPFSYFKDLSTTPAKCNNCPLNCKQCNSTQICYNCNAGYLVVAINSNKTQCITQCPTHYYKKTNTGGFQVCQQCSADCLVCLDSHQCTKCQPTHTLINFECVPNNCVNCNVCDKTVNPPVCKNCSNPYYLYKIKCLDSCPVYYYPAIDVITNGPTCGKCIENCVKCFTNITCDQCIPDYIFAVGQGCVNEAIHQYGQAANISGFTSNITQTMATIYMGTSVGPVAFGEMSTTYFNLQFTQFMQYHPTGGNPEMTQFLNSLQTMSLSSGGTTASTSTAPSQVQARRRMLSTSTYYTESFIQVNASIFFIMFAFLGAYSSIFIFKKFITQACRVSCNSVWFYLDTICDFMEKRFKWIYFDFVMWLSYVPFLYFSIMQLKEFKFQNFSQGLSSLLAIVIIGTYPLYPVFICYLLKSNYSQISTEPGEQEIKQTMTQMSLSPYLSKVKRPIKNMVLPFEEQQFTLGKYFNSANFILIYYPLKYLRKFTFVIITALVADPATLVGTLIGLNVLFIAYMIILRPRTMPYMIFDLIIEFVLLAFEVFLLIYLVTDGSKVAIMSIVTHVVGFVTANLSLLTAIILNLIAYYKIFLCIKDLISHIREKAAERNQAQNKFEQQKKFLNPDDPIYIDKQVGKLRRLGDNDDTDQDDEQMRLSQNGRKLLQNLGQKDLLLNGIDPIKYVKNLTKTQNYGIQQKQLALKYVNEDDITDSDDSQLDQNIVQLAKKLQMNQKNLALNQIHPVKFAKQLTKDDASLDKRYKKFDQKHIDRKIAKRINDDGLTDSDDQVDDDLMNIARNLKLDQKQLAANQINPVKYLKDQTKIDAPLEDRYKKFDQKNVDKKLARIINQDNATDSNDSQIDEQLHDLAKKLQLNEKQLAFNKINPIKFFKEQTKKDAPLEQQYQKFDEKHMDKKLANRINQQHDTDSQDDSSVDQDAHKIARKLNLNEKQLAANQINPLKFFKQQTKKDAPLQEVYKKFDEKNVDRQLSKVINNDEITDSDQSEDDTTKEGYRMARDLKLNEKQLAANKLNPVKVMQDQAKQNQKLQNVLRQFDQKDIDFKLARMINDNGQTSSESSSSDEEQRDKIILARHLKLDQKQLAANNINPMKFMKEATKVDPKTNEPKINLTVLSTTVTGKNIDKARRKLLDKQLELRNEMKRQKSEDSNTDQDQEDIKLSKYNKDRLNRMTQKQMMMEGLDPIKAVKRITKEAIAKKMAKQQNNPKNNRVYDDQIPDFKVGPKQSSSGAAVAIKNAVKNTQQKLKQSVKNIRGTNKNTKGGEKIPSEQNEYKIESNLIDSQSDQQNFKLNNPKMNQSARPQIKKQDKKKLGRNQIQQQWNDQFEVVTDKKNNKVANQTQSKKAKQNEKQQKILLIDPNNKIKNFDQQFEQNILSEQSSEAALHPLKHRNQEDLDSIDLEHMKPTTIVAASNSQRVIDLDIEKKDSRSTIQKGNKDNKKSNSALNFKQPKKLRQDEAFNEFEQFEDLGNVQQKVIKQRKHQKSNNSIPNSGKMEIKSKKDIFDHEELAQQQIINAKPKQITEAKYKKNQKLNEKGLPAEVTQSVTFNQPIQSNKSIQSQNYEQAIKKNKSNLKLPQTFQDANQAFEQANLGIRPESKMNRPRKNSHLQNSSDDQQISTELRKQRNSARQRIRSRNDSQSNGPQSKGSTLVVKGDRQTKKRIQKLKIQNMSEDEDQIQKIQM